MSNSIVWLSGPSIVRYFGYEPGQPGLVRTAAPYAARTSASVEPKPIPFAVRGSAAATEW